MSTVLRCHVIVLEMFLYSSISDLSSMNLRAIVDHKHFKEKAYFEIKQCGVMK